MGKVTYEWTIDIETMTLNNPSSATYNLKWKDDTLMFLRKDGSEWSITPLWVRYMYLEQRDQLAEDIILGEIDA